MADIQSSIVNRIDKETKQNTEGARAIAQYDHQMSNVRRGIILSVNGSIAKVAVINMVGETAYSVDGVIAWGTYTPVAGDKVMVVYDSMNIVPFIISGGGGDGGNQYYSSLLTGYLGIISE